MSTRLQVSVQGTQLFIRSFELGVMFLPSLEDCYRQHPHRGFSCDPQDPGSVHPNPEAAGPSHTASGSTGGLPAHASQVTCTRKVQDAWHARQMLLDIL